MGIHSMYTYVHVCACTPDPVHWRISEDVQRRLVFTEVGPLDERLVQCSLVYTQAPFSVVCLRICGITYVYT